MKGTRAGHLIAHSAQTMSEKKQQASNYMEGYSEERIQLENCIKDLIPTDRGKFKEIFKIEDSDVDYYKEEVRVMLHMMHPEITWDKDTGEVILENFGTIQGKKILALLSEFMENDDWLMFTLGPYSEKFFVNYLTLRWLDYMMN